MSLAADAADGMEATTAGIPGARAAPATSALDGDLEAALYRVHGPALYRFCRRLLRDPEAAQDVSQDAWLRALTALRRAEVPRDRFRPWLFTVARNRCIDALRRPLADELDAARGRFAATEPGPEQAVERREEIELLWRDLKSLSHAQRAAIILHEIAGLSLRELAEVLDRPDQACRFLLADGRAALRERREGRALACSDTRARIDRLEVRGRRVRAHLESCPSCRAHARRVRAQRGLAAHGLFPLPYLERLYALASRWVAGLGGASAHACERVGTKVGALCAAATVAAGGGIAVREPARDERPSARAAATETDRQPPRRPAVRMTADGRAAAARQPRAGRRGRGRAAAEPPQRPAPKPEERAATAPPAGSARASAPALRPEDELVRAAERQAAKIEAVGVDIERAASAETVAPESLESAAAVATDELTRVAAALP